MGAVINDLRRLVNTGILVHFRSMEQPALVLPRDHTGEEFPIPNSDYCSRDCAFSGQPNVDGIALKSRLGS